MAENSERSDQGDASFDAFLRNVARVSQVNERVLLARGTRLASGRFEVLRRLGEGGMGVVYEARDLERRTNVALKTLSRLDAPGIYRLKNEFRALADVSHPNLVRLYELFADEGQWFFTMDLVDGVRFDAWVRPEGTLDEARLRAALPELLAAIVAIHDAGKLHRDLKPSNVLVTDAGEVRVLDFGLAIDPEPGGVGQTVADEGVSGTPGYMAPEQASGKTATAASDFYALGAMLFEALAGRLPFEGRAGELLAAKQTREAPRASALASAVPADLDALAARLLARDPARRPEAAALRAELGANERASGTRPIGRASAPPAPPLLLGRDDELRALHAAFDATLAGRAVLVFVSGESGMGKSTLVASFLDGLRSDERAVVLGGRCYERENVPYKGFDALVDELSRYLRKLPAQEAAAVLPREAFALARIFPVLDRVPVVASAPKKQVPDPQDLKRRAFEAFGELMARIRDRAPLAVVIDDLQWIDQDSVRFMRALLLHREPVPALLVCVHRSEGASENALLQSVAQAASENSALDVRELAVGPLPEHALCQLARRLLPRGLEPRAAELFAAEACGSPFFAAELARAAAARGPSAPPPSLRDALALHVASLPPPTRKLLSLLSLAGQPLAPALAADAAGLRDGHSELDRLRAEQLVRVAFDSDGGRKVECYHDKIREHVAAGLDASEARELAAGLARGLLAQGEPDLELLSRALDLAGRAEQAAEQAALAAEKAFAALAFDRAARLYEGALERGRFEPSRLRALLAGKAQALAFVGQGERAAEAFLEAAEGADEAEVYELTRRASEQYMLCGELERGRELLARALQGIGIAFPRTRAAALTSLAWSRARLRLRGLRLNPRRAHDPATLRELEALGTLTHSLVRSDQLRAMDFCARWALLALESGHEVELARALGWEVMFASLMGTPDHKVAEIERRCRRLCEQSGDWLASYGLAFSLGNHLNFRFGNSAAALEQFERSLELLQANPSSTTSYDRSWSRHFASSCLLLSGRFAEAGEVAHGQLEEALSRGDRTVSTALAATVCVAMIAADRPERAARILELAPARLQPGEETAQDFFWLWLEPLPAVYQGRIREGWYQCAELRERFSKSFVGRFILPGMLEHGACGLAVAASSCAESEAERAALIRSAERLAKRARRSRTAVNLGIHVAALACLRGDRAGAIAGLRERLKAPLAPFRVRLIQRRLGELLGGDEGAALVAEADAAMRAGGVVDPARFTRAMMPGVELAGSKTPQG